MCLSPIKIRTRARNISLKGGQSMWITVPCGQCAECLQQKRNEWYFRSFYEAQECYNQGGYVYFSTLTYSDKTVPHLSDFFDFEKIARGKGELKYLRAHDYMCFNREDLKLFFKRLRRKLDYNGFKSKDCFKYFLTSEYGTSDKGTHRPHYHCLFFVKDPSLNPMLFSQYINQCWQKGITDGIDFKPMSYVMNHVYGPKYSTDFEHMQSACRYVSKYITKDSTFSRLARNRVDRLMKKVFGLDWRQKMLSGDDISVFWTEYRKDVPTDDDYIEVEENVYDDVSFDDYQKGVEPKVIKTIVKRIPIELPWDEEVVRREVLYTAKDLKKTFDFCVKKIDQFHLQSDGFGESFLKYNTVDEIMQYGQIKMMTKDGIKFLNLPRYYQMKLFYDLKRDFNNHLYYQLNDDGIRYKIARQDSAIKSIADKLEMWRLDMRWANYYCDIEDPIKRFHWYDRIIDEFDRLNGDRPMSQFVEYLMCYKGRIKSYAQVERESRGEFYVDDLQSFRKSMFTVATEDKDVIYNYSTPTDEDVLGTKFISKKYYGDAELFKKYEGSFPTFDQLLNLEGIDMQWFNHTFVITDKCDSKFRDYDRMYDLWCTAQKYKNKYMQLSFDQKEELKKKFKENMRKDLSF